MPGGDGGDGLGTGVRGGSGGEGGNDGGLSRQLEIGMRSLSYIESVPSRRICVICEDQPREVRFNCGHACCCGTCAALVRAKDNLCPTCRTPLGSRPFASVGRDATTYVRRS